MERGTVQPDVLALMSQFEIYVLKVSQKQMINILFLLSLGIVEKKKNHCMIIPCNWRLRFVLSTKTVLLSFFDHQILLLGLGLWTGFITKGEAMPPDPLDPHEKMRTYVFLMVSASLIRSLPINVTTLQDGSWCRSTFLSSISSPPSGSLSATYFGVRIEPPCVLSLVNR